MNTKKLLALICAASLALAGCSGSTPAETQNTPAETTAAPETETTTETETETAATPAETETETETPDKISLHIDGYDAQNIPRLDGSLANEPLLIRIMQELTGVDASEAEIYLADSFVNGGTSTSWPKLIYNEMDLIISYEAPQEVKDMYAEEMDTLEIDSLGRDGLVFIVNKNNPIESLTVDQIRDIYTGRITDWSQVGGEPGAIRAFQRNSTSGSQTLLNKLVMNGETTVEPDKDLLIGTMGELIESVASFDGSGSAIGFSVYYYADRMKADPNLKMIRVNDVTPSNASIEDGTYPLTNDFYIAIRKDTAADSPARALRDWLLGDQGKTLLEEEGYVWAGK